VLHSGLKLPRGGQLLEFHLHGKQFRWCGSAQLQQNHCQVQCRESLLALLTARVLPASSTSAAGLLSAFTHCFTRITAGESAYRQGEQGARQQTDTGGDGNSLDLFGCVATHQAPSHQWADPLLLNVGMRLLARSSGLRAGERLRAVHGLSLAQGRQGRNMEVRILVKVVKGVFSGTEAR
jgi:hypothetical protein